MVGLWQRSGGSAPGKDNTRTKGGRFGRPTLRELGVTLRAAFHQAFAPLPVLTTSDYSRYLNEQVAGCTLGWHAFRVAAEATYLLQHGFGLHTAVIQIFLACSVSSLLLCLLRRHVWLCWREQICIGMNCVYGVVTFLKVFDVLPRLPNESNYLFKHCLLSIADAFFCQVRVHKFYVAQFLDASLRCVVWRRYNVLPGARTPVVVLVSLAWQGWILAFSCMLQARHVTSYLQRRSQPESQPEPQLRAAEPSAEGQQQPRPQQDHDTHRHAQAQEMRGVMAPPLRREDHRCRTPQCDGRSGSDNTAGRGGGTFAESRDGEGQWKSSVDAVDASLLPEVMEPESVPSPPDEEHPRAHADRHPGARELPARLEPLVQEPQQRQSHLRPHPPPQQQPPHQRHAHHHQQQQQRPQLHVRYAAPLLRSPDSRPTVSVFGSTTTTVTGSDTGADANSPGGLAQTDLLLSRCSSNSTRTRSGLSTSSNHLAYRVIAAGCHGGGDADRSSEALSCSEGEAPWTAPTPCAGTAPRRGRGGVVDTLGGERLGPADLLEDGEDEEDYLAPIPMLSMVELGQDARTLAARGPSLDAANRGTEADAVEASSSRRGLADRGTASSAASSTNSGTEGAATAGAGDGAGAGIPSARAVASAAASTRRRPSQTSILSPVNGDFSCMLGGAHASSSSRRARQTEALRRLVRGPSSYVLLARQRERDQNMRVSANVQVVVASGDPSQLGAHWRDKLASVISESATGWQLANVSARKGSLIVHLDLVYHPATATGEQAAASSGGCPAQDVGPTCGPQVGVDTDHGDGDAPAAHGGDPPSLLPHAARAARPPGRSLSGGAVTGAGTGQGACPPVEVLERFFQGLGAAGVLDAVSLSEHSPASAEDYVSVQCGERMIRYGCDVAPARHDVSPDQSPPWCDPEIECATAAAVEAAGELGDSGGGSAAADAGPSPNTQPCPRRRRGTALQQRLGAASVEGGAALMTRTAPGGGGGRGDGGVHHLVAALSAARRCAAALSHITALALFPPPLVASADYQAFLHARVVGLHMAYVHFMAFTTFVFYMMNRGSGLRLSNILAFMAPELLTLAARALTGGGRAWAAARAPLVHVGVVLRGVLLILTCLGVMPRVTEGDECSEMRCIMKMLIISALQVTCMQTPVLWTFAARLVPLAGSAMLHVRRCHRHGSMLAGLGLHVAWDVVLFLLAAIMQARHIAAFRLRRLSSGGASTTSLAPSSPTGSYYSCTDSGLVPIGGKLSNSSVAITSASGADDDGQTSSLKSPPVDVAGGAMTLSHGGEAGQASVRSSSFPSLLPRDDSPRRLSHPGTPADTAAAAVRGCSKQAQEAPPTSTERLWSTLADWQDVAAAAGCEYGGGAGGGSGSGGADPWDISLDGRVLAIAPRRASVLHLAFTCGASVVEELQVILRHISPTSMTTGVHSASPASVITRTLAAPAAAQVQHPGSPALRFVAELTMVAAPPDTPGVVHVELWRSARRLVGWPVLLTSAGGDELGADRGGGGGSGAVSGRMRESEDVAGHSNSTGAAAAAAAADEGGLPAWLQDVQAYVRAITAEGHLDAADQFLEELGCWLATLAAQQRGLTAGNDVASGGSSIAANSAAANSAVATRISRILRVHSSGCVPPPPQPPPLAGPFPALLDSKKSAAAGGLKRPPRAPSPLALPHRPADQKALLLASKPPPPLRRQTGSASGAAPPSPDPGAVTPPDSASVLIRQMLLCQGQGLLAVAVEAGCLALSDRLTGLLTRALGASLEGVLEAAVTPVTGLPLMHAAVKSGCTQMVDLVADWHAHSGAAEVWNREAVVRAISLEPRNRLSGDYPGAPSTIRAGLHGTEADSELPAAGHDGFEQPAAGGGPGREHGADAVGVGGGPAAAARPAPLLAGATRGVVGGAAEVEAEAEADLAHVAVEQQRLMILTRCDSMEEDEASGPGAEARAARRESMSRDLDLDLGLGLGLGSLGLSNGDARSDGRDSGVSLTGSFLLETGRQSLHASIANMPPPAVAPVAASAPTSAAAQRLTRTPSAPVPIATSVALPQPPPQTPPELNPTAAAAAAAAESTLKEAAAAAANAAAYTATGVSVAAAVAAADLSPPSAQQAVTQLSAPFKILCFRPETTGRASSAVQVLPRDAHDVIEAPAGGLLPHALWDGRCGGAILAGGASEITAAAVPQLTMPSALEAEPSRLQAGAAPGIAAAAGGDGGAVGVAGLGGAGGGGGSPRPHRTSAECQWTLVDGGVLLLTPLHVALALGDEGRVASHILAKYQDAHEIWMASQAQFAVIGTGNCNIAASTMDSSCAMASPFVTPGAVGPSSSFAGLAAPLMPSGISQRRGASTTVTTAGAATSTGIAMAMALHSNASQVRYRSSNIGVGTFGAGGSAGVVTHGGGGGGGGAGAGAGAGPGAERSTPRGWLRMSTRALSGCDETSRAGAGAGAAVMPPPPPPQKLGAIQDVERDEEPVQPLSLAKAAFMEGLRLSAKESRPTHTSEKVASGAAAPGGSGARGGGDNGDGGSGGGDNGRGLGPAGWGRAASKWQR